MTTPEERLRRYAELAVRVGANVENGQYVLVDGLIEHAPLVRAIADVAYEAGAAFVDVRYTDLHIRRSMLERGPDEALQFTPDWMVQRLERAGEREAAQIIVANYPDASLFSGIDPARLGRAQQRSFNEAHMKNVTGRLVNWTLLAYPNETWAERVYGEPDLDRLWTDISAAVRLDDDDPVQSWKEHLAQLATRAETLNSHKFDAIRFQGPGTDLKVGLLSKSLWTTALSTTRFGRSHVVNLPTDEVFTSPDRMRADGIVSSTIDLVTSATTVVGLKLQFEGGRIIDVEAEQGADYVREQLATDEGASRLGEVALIDESSAVGRLGRTFYQALFDENAACHLAYGHGFPYCVEGGVDMTTDEQLAIGLNQSAVHVDFMIGSEQVDVFGVDERGEETPIIIGNQWKLR